MIPWASYLGYQNHRQGCSWKTDLQLFYSNIYHQMCSTKLLLVYLCMSVQKQGKKLLLSHNSSTGDGHTKQTKKSLVFILHSVYVTLFYKSG